MEKLNVFVAGHKGMVGAAILRKLQSIKEFNLIVKTRDELDLCDQAAVMSFFELNNIDQVYLAAAKVGGILANNTYPADFIYQNLQIQNNVIGAANKYNIENLLFLGSSCIYPRLAPQPIKEEYLLTGILEPTNEPYALAKIAGIKLCESINRQFNRDYRCIMPTNLYGPGDNYHLENSHVIPSLLRKFHEAKINELSPVSIWGTGAPKREFLHVDDLAEAAIHIMSLPFDKWKSITAMHSHINVGAGNEISISELATLIAEIVSYKGEITFDTNKPDGVPRKLLDISRIESTDWAPTINLREGLIQTYKTFIAHCVRK
jgi:GDP-L-fucose synthase